MIHTLGEIARAIGADLEGDAGCEIRGIGTLEKAVAGELSFFSNRRYTAHLKSTRASAVIIKAKDRGQSPVATLAHDNPYLGYALAARLLAITTAATARITAQQERPQRPQRNIQVHSQSQPKARLQYHIIQQTEQDGVRK